MKAVLARAPQDTFARYALWLMGGETIPAFITSRPQDVIDVALDFMHAGLNAEAAKVVCTCTKADQMVNYYLAYVTGNAPAHNDLTLRFPKGEYEAAMVCFKSAQVLPDTLGAGLWNEVLLVPHRFFEAECLTALGHSNEANAIYFDIAALLIDYFSNMQLPELRCWQALCWARLGQAGRSMMMLKEHIRLFEDSKSRRDAGYFKTTPFFISFMEPAKKLRNASCDWQIAMAYWAMGEHKKAAEHARSALAGEPFTLYARLLISCIEG